MKKFVGAVFLLGTVMTQQVVACDMGAIEAWVASICDDNDCATVPTAQSAVPPKVGYPSGYRGVDAPKAACHPPQLQTASDGQACDSARCRSNSLSCPPSLGNVGW